ncbi:MAG: proline dehydrogenase family protein [Bacteroidota bacterium]|nr:proline dehydrogenase family protein [Candidatus Kapabacteria bacterium]MDW8219265.1 proline dehydrogenase family protein [Bacteroidota bacterium]
MFNQLIARTLPIVPKPIVRRVSQRYIAGETINDAVQAVQRLQQRGAVATIDVLGEFVRSREQAQQEAGMSLHVLDAIHQHDLRSGVSVKLTSLGLDIDDALCYTNVRNIVARAAEIGRFVRLDMENSPYTTKTLDIYRRLRSEGFANTGVVIQAYMRRSEDDIRLLASDRASVRLCKGIYIEPEEIAFRKREEIQEHYKRLLCMLFDNGMYVAIATHDDVLLDFAQEEIIRRGLRREQYEFQMLLGVREHKRDELIRAGHKVRIYVPFGHDWYGYSIRRLQENPEVAGHIVKAMFGIGR